MYNAPTVWDSISVDFMASSASATVAEPPSFLIITIDIDERSWASHGGSTAAATASGGSHSNGDGTVRTQTTFDELLKVLVVFINAYLLVHRQNRLAVLTYSKKSASIIFPDTTKPAASSSKDIFIPIHHTISSLIVDGLLREFYNAADNEAVVALNGTSALSSSAPPSHIGNQVASCLARALCIFQKQLQVDPLRQFQPRILNIQMNRDLPSTYNSIMNSLFSAQKLGVVIDAVILSVFESSFFQQACFLTQGVYSHPADQRSILQLLLTSHLPSNMLRSSVINIPNQKTIDLKLSCHCHGRAVDFTYLCSVCLTATCEAPQTCSVCQSTRKKRKVP